MSPTNLGVLPSNLPFPNQRVQIKRGAASTDQSVSGAGPTTCVDGVGGLMQISYQPRYDCYWLVRTNSIWRGRSDAAGAWYRADHSIRINPADVNGLVLGHARPVPCYPSGAVNWRTHSCSVMFRLAAGITYTASLCFEISYGSYQEYHTGTAWTRILGVVIGEGEV